MYARVNIFGNDHHTCLPVISYTPSWQAAEVRRASQATRITLRCCGTVYPAIVRRLRYSIPGDRQATAKTRRCTVRIFLADPNYSLFSRRLCWLLIQVWNSAPQRICSSLCIVRSNMILRRRSRIVSRFSH